MPPTTKSNKSSNVTSPATTVAIAATLAAPVASVEAPPVEAPAVQGEIAPPVEAGGIVPLKVGEVPTEEQMAHLNGAFHTLYRLTMHYGKDALPGWDKVGQKSRVLIAQRALDATKSYIDAKIKVERDAFTAMVAGVCKAAIDTHKAGKVAYDNFAASAPEAMRALLKPYPSHIEVQGASFASIFTQGEVIGAQMGKFLKFDYKVVETGTAEAKSYKVFIPVTFDAPATATPAAV